LARALSAAAGKRYLPQKLPLNDLELSTSDRKVSFTVGARRWQCTLSGDSCSERTTPNPNEVLSPDGRHAVFIREHNLWVRQLEGGSEFQVTTDGVTDFGYATDNPGWSHSPRAVVLWSPDSKRIATFQQDERGVGEAYLIRTRRGHPELEAWKYPMSGDAVIPKVHRVIIDVETRRVVRLQMPPDPVRSPSSYGLTRPDGRLSDASWSADSTRLIFISASRNLQHVQLRVANAADGSVRDVVDERVPTVYETDANWHWLEGSRQVLWQSARDNWDHLYLYDFDTGKLLRQVTSGEWNVTRVVRVDERRREVFFLGVGREPGRNPYFEHFYKVSLDGGRPVLLTPENANHEIWMAPDGEFFVSSFSTPQSAPVAVLRNRRGKLLQTLEQADISKLLATGWQAPVDITVKARDGVTDLYGLMFKPTDFDERRRYPIINAIYPGPSIGSVQLRKFSVSRGLGDVHSLAELGFIVVQIDGMGTPTRSKAFHDAHYGDLADNTLPDQLAGMKELARRYSWIDESRAGIYGISGGGYATARALFEYPDFFKVGISISGNHDQQSYTDNWGEKWMGLLERKPDGTSNYDGQANQSVADRLKGHLLLVYGTGDDNVPPNSTLLLIDALIKANKDFDLLVLPNERHWPVGAAANYLTRRRWDYFIQYLQGNTPPKEFAMQARSPEEE
jgi:dipeptidyl aminopeptidase/acylaminoacyl peptidase